MTSRAKIYSQTRPEPDVRFDELVRVDAYNPKSVDPRFLRNSNIPVDPAIEAKKHKDYLDEVERWSELGD